MSATTLGAVSLSKPQLGPHPQGHRAHHPDKSTDKFVNPWPSWAGTAPPMQFARARLAGEITATAPKDVMQQVKWQTTDFSILPSEAGQRTEARRQSKVAWLGHAASFIEFPCSETSHRGLRVLCDPVFSKRCSPSQWFGPARYTPATTTVADLPEIDLLVLSHNHYDHLDETTMRLLHRRFRDLHYVVPLRVKKWMLTLGIHPSAIVEMDWWESLTFRKNVPTVSSNPEGQDSTPLELKVTYLPAQHFTGRSLSDQGMTLWGSYALSSQSSKIYFAGDTGRRTIPASMESTLQTAEPGSSDSAKVESRRAREERIGLDKLPTCPVHRQIGQLIGPFNLSLIPIGAYYPRRLMSPVHVDPGEAIDIFKELETSRAVGIHWGTFSLSGEDVLEPKTQLAKLCREENVEGFECWDMGKLMFI